MTITFGQVVVWLVVGALAGAVAAKVVTFRKEGYGLVANLGIGLAGALIGGVLFSVLGVDLGLPVFTIGVQDFIAAFLGSLVFVFLLWLTRARSKPE
jgi:uncharacterized membrane protein YeaQ/YmgE (transglycosylase-associated protein family)